jgi:hypothetical protein
MRTPNVLTKSVVTKKELRTAGARFSPFGFDQEYLATVKIEQETRIYRKVDDNKYQLMR